jgi:hypothetical protein
MLVFKQICDRVNSALASVSDPIYVPAKKCMFHHFYAGEKDRNGIFHHSSEHSGHLANLCRESEAGGGLCDKVPT